MIFDKNKSIEQLENDFWDEPNFFSGLVTQCHKLRRIPISELTSGNLRLLIGQQIGLQYTIPLALECLNIYPFDDGDRFEGALLQNVLRINVDFWVNHKDLYCELLSVMNKLNPTDEVYQEHILPYWQKLNIKNP